MTDIQPVCILVIDEKAEGLALLSRRLSAEGFTLQKAQSGQQALQCLQVSRPDLILVSSSLPDMDKLELVKQVREKTRGERRLPILIVTSDSNVETRVAMLTGGADDLIMKPYAVEELLARIATQIRINEMESRLIESEKMKAVFDMARAACHELSQPLTAVMGYTQLLLRNKTENDPEYASLRNLLEGAERAGTVIKKIQQMQANPNDNFYKLVSEDFR